MSKTKRFDGFEIGGWTFYTSVTDGLITVEVDRRKFSGRSTQTLAAEIGANVADMHSTHVMRLDAALVRLLTRA